MGLTKRERRAEVVGRLCELRDSEERMYSEQLLDAMLGETGDGWTVDKDCRDLIDLLSEDECTDEANDPRIFKCSVCGMTLDTSDEHGEPTMWDKGGVPAVPTYCPGCGSVVTYQNDFVNTGKPYHPGDAVLDAGVISSEETCDAHIGRIRDGLHSGVSAGRRSDAGDGSREGASGLGGHENPEEGRDDPDERFHGGVPDREHSDSGADDGAQDVDGLDSRERLEADIRSKPMHTITTLAWPQSANDVKEMLWSVSVEEAIGWIDRQAQITAREQFESRAQVLGIYHELMGQYEEQHVEVANLREQVAELTEGRDELVGEVNHLMGEVTAKSDIIGVLEHDRDDWRDRAEDMRMERDDNAAAICKLKQQLNDGGLLFPVDANLEFIHVGDRLEEGTAKHLLFNKDGWMVLVEHEDWSLYRKPETLHLWHPRGKDDQPIMCDDVVYGEDGIRFEVTGILKNKDHCIVGRMSDGHNKFLKPEWLSHEKPKTVEDVLRTVVTLCHSIWHERDECWDVDSIMESGNMQSFIEDIEKIRTRED